MSVRVESGCCLKDCCAKRTFWKSNMEAGSGDQRRNTRRRPFCCLDVFAVVTLFVSFRASRHDVIPFFFFSETRCIASPPLALPSRSEEKTNTSTNLTICAPQPAVYREAQHPVSTGLCTRPGVQMGRDDSGEVISSAPSLLLRRESVTSAASRLFGTRVIAQTVTVKMRPYP